MKNKKKYIKIFALSLLFMISISFNAEVKAETNYFDENGVMYRLIFDDTSLKNFVKRDFALYYNQKDLQNKDIARLENEDRNYIYSLGFSKDEELKIAIFETSKTWQENNEEKYIVSVIPDFLSGNEGATSPRIYENVILKTRDTYRDYWFSGKRYDWNCGEYNLNYLNFEKNKSNISIYEDIGISSLEGIQDLLIIVNKDGTIQRYKNIQTNNSNLSKEIQNNAQKNLIYSNLDVYSNETGQIVRPKDEIRKDIIVKKEIKVNTDESNNINFKIFNLKKDDKIKIIKKDKNGNYTENDVVETTITIDLNENQSYLVKDENIKENKIYDIKVYNNKNEIIYNEEYIHTMKNYILEDTTEEKNKLINLEDYKINNKLANVIKNIFIIGNNEYLGKIIFLVFTITIITIIRKMV